MLFTHTIPAKTQNVHRLIWNSTNQNHTFLNRLIARVKAEN